MTIEQEVQKVEAIIETPFIKIRNAFHAGYDAIAEHIAALEARIEALEAAVKKAV